MKRLMLFCLIAGTLPIGVSAFIEGDDMTNSTTRNVVTKLRSLKEMTPEEKEALLSSLGREWQQVEGVLVTNLGSEDDETRFCSAYLLGLYRYSYAAGSLARKITMENTKLKDNERMARWQQYPAVEALIRIGKPSVPAMLRNLESSSDKHVRGLSARVIFYVEGAQIGRLIVENAIAKEDDPVKKKNLEEALPLIKGGEYKRE